MAVTIRDVATLAGVSPSTVSRTCKNNPSISEETKEKVRAAMAKLGYEPNFQASNLASQNSRTIGIVLPASERSMYVNSFFLEMIRGITIYCNSHQYRNYRNLRTQCEKFYVRLTQLLKCYPNYN